MLANQWEGSPCMTQIRETCTRDTDPGRGQAAPRSQHCWRLGVGAGKRRPGAAPRRPPRGRAPLPHLWGKAARHRAHGRKSAHRRWRSCPCSEPRFRGIPRPLPGNASEAVAEASRIQTLEESRQGWGEQSH